MPRISPRSLRQARIIHRLLPTLLPVCRDIPSASNELRWLREHSIKIAEKTAQGDAGGIFRQFVARRARGEPLQYILGSEYFGDLEIKCRRGVLIPRQDTAASVAHLAKIISSNEESVTPSKRLRVLDLCTGTGCILLLFHHEFYSAPANEDVALLLVGVDISHEALNLAHENLDAHIQRQLQDSKRATTGGRALQDTVLLEADVLRNCSNKVRNSPLPLMQALKQYEEQSRFDVLISNPPYVSSSAYTRVTSHSVRNYEPKLALVPPPAAFLNATEDGDSFYPRLLEVAQAVHAKTILFEVANMQQAERVATMVVRQEIWDTVEIWRDDPADQSGALAEIVIGNKPVLVRGSGHGRSVVAHRGHKRGCSLNEGSKG